MKSLNAEGPSSMAAQSRFKKATESDDEIGS